MPVTQKDIAEHLGISRGLVGYALNGNPRVSEKTREQVLEMAKRTGYRSNSAARALVTGRTYQVNLCLPALGNSFFSEIIREFENLTHDTPYDLIVTTIKGSESRQHSVTVDGTIFYGSGPLPPEVPAGNVVMLRHHLSEVADEPDKKYDVMLLNLTEASRQGVAHLIGQGFKRIAYIAPAVMMRRLEPRYGVYLDAMAEAGLNAEIIGVPIPLEARIREQTSPWLIKHFQENGFPDALFCSSDDIAVGAIRALRKLGRSIPDQTAVLGVDDISEAQDLTPALSSIHLPIEEICRSAWTTLLSRMEGKHTAPITKVFQANLVIRESSLNHGISNDAISSSVANNK